MEEKSRLPDLPARELPQDKQPAMKLFRLPDGLRVWNSPNSGGETQFLHREIFKRHSYEKHGVIPKHGDVVFDVGANVGMFALSLMKRFTDLRIFCLEPVPSTYACLRRNLNEWPEPARHKVTALNLGLGASEGEMTIEFFPDAPGNSTLHPQEKHRDFAKILEGVRFGDLWRMNKTRAALLLPLFPFRKRLLGPAFERVLAKGVPISCQVGTLSGIIREYQVERIDLLKIDVEGAELDVLAGIDDADWPVIRQVCMEVDPANKRHLTALLDSLRSFGFAKIVVESMFGGPCNPHDAVPCMVYAARPNEPPAKSPMH